MEGGSEDVLRVRILHAQHVEHHVVAQVVGTVQRVWVAVQHALGHVRLHGLVQHLDHDTAVVLATTTSTATHLPAGASAAKRKESRDRREGSRRCSVLEAGRSEVQMCCQATVSSLLPLNIPPDATHRKSTYFIPEYILQK